MDELLNVGAVVEGSVRRSDVQLRITVQLIRVSDGYHLWSARYDRKPDDVFAVQEEIGREIAEAIRTELGVRDTWSWLQRSRYATPDVRAYKLLRQAVDLEQTHTEEGFRGEVEYTLRALEIDPDYAQAHAQLAWGRALLWFWYYDTRPEVLAQARAGALRALELDPENGSAHNLLVYQAMHEGDWFGAEERVKSALQASPNQGPLRESYGIILMSTDRLEEALVQLRRAVSLDPLAGPQWRDLGTLHLVMGDLESAIEAFERSLEYGWPAAVGSLIHAHHVSGRDEDGLAVMIQASRAPQDAEAIRSAHAATGYPGAVRAWLEANGGGSGACPTSVPFSAPVLLSVAEEEDRLFDCLDEVAEQERIGLALLKVHPAYDPYRDDPRFHALLRKWNLEDAPFASE